ncbi:unnamed protein product [Caenorhabditis auriculariae]|uniref:Uncharacterized protein n=1 Tax=Caenorhabditis auriculariae TaxID=2777116 RepID=A0A8S1GWG1_9PELO|nr:unnamed protein product [Caenorhabditis auriculariae]
MNATDSFSSASMDAKLNETRENLASLEALTSRSYAYLTAFTILFVLGILVVIHVAIVRHARERQQRAMFAEWTPLLREKLPPPPPYDQII